MITNLAILIIGLVVLILGGDFLVRGATNLALRLHITPLVVGLTVVAFGTSAPELLISIKAALAGSPDLTMGNVVGSNICNLALVLGITAVIAPIQVQVDSIKINWPVTMGSTILLFIIAREGSIHNWEGVVFLILLSTYTFLIIRRSRRASRPVIEIEKNEGLPESAQRNLTKDLGYIALGSLGLFFGAEWFVGSAQDLARFLGVSERVIGITVLALGTSLPELVTAIVASIKRETDLALGNLLGSNIFNILSILGITSIIQEIHVNDVIRNVDIVWMLIITMVILPMMMSSRTIARGEGIVLLSIYVYYTYTVVT